MAHLKRLKKDLKCLQKEPLIGAAAAPQESDFTTWDGVIMIDLTETLTSNDTNDENATKTTTRSCPMHFLIVFPDD